MYGMVFSAVMFCKVMYLGMAIMACSDAVIRACGYDLVEFDLAVLPSCVRVSGLQKASASSAAVVVRLVGMHLDKIFLSHDRLYDVAQIIGHGVTKTLSHDLAGILNRELDFQILIPIGVYLQFTFTDPFCVILVNARNLQICPDVELFQSGPD